MLDPKMTEILGKIERRFRNNSGSLLALAAVLAATLAERPLPSMADVSRWIEALGSPDAPKEIAMARAKTLLDVLGGVTVIAASGAAKPEATTRAATARKPQRPSPTTSRGAKPAAKKRAAAPKRR